MGVPGSSLPGVLFQLYLNILSDFFLICCSQTAKDKRLTINPQLHCVFLVDNQFIHMYSESPKVEVQKSKNELKNDAII